MPCAVSSREVSGLSLEFFRVEVVVTCRHSLNLNAAVGRQSLETGLDGMDSLFHRTSGFGSRPFLSAPSGVNVHFQLCYVFCNPPNSEHAHLFISPTPRTTHIVLVSTRSTRTLHSLPPLNLYFQHAINNLDY